MYSRFRDMKSLPALGLLPLVDKTVPPEKLRSPETGVYGLDLKNSSVTGWDRVKFTFYPDGWGNLSPPLSFIIKFTITSFVALVCAKSINSFTEVKRNFIQNFNTEHFEGRRHARRFLDVLLIYHSFGPGLKSSIPIAALFGTYMTAGTVLTVYRGDVQISDHFISGGLAGVVYKFPKGSRAALIGGLVSGLLGTVVGTIIWLALKASGSTIDDIWEISEWVDLQRNCNLKTNTNKDELLRTLRSHAEELGNISVEKPDLKETSKGSTAISVMKSNESGKVIEMN